MWELKFLEEGIDFPNSHSKVHLKKGIKQILTRNVRIIDLTTLNFLETFVLAILFEWRKCLFCILCKILGQIKVSKFLFDSNEPTSKQNVSMIHFLLRLHFNMKRDANADNCKIQNYWWKIVLGINTVKLLYLRHLHKDLYFFFWYYFLEIFQILMEKMKNILKNTRIFEVAVITLISVFFYKENYWHRSFLK